MAAARLLPRVALREGRAVLGRDVGLVVVLQVAGRRRRVAEGQLRGVVRGAPVEPPHCECVVLVGLVLEGVAPHLFAELLAVGVDLVERRAGV